MKIERWTADRRRISTAGLPARTSEKRQRTCSEPPGSKLPSKNAHALLRSPTWCLVICEKCGSGACRSLDKIESAVKERMRREITHLQHRALELEAEERAGRRPRLNSENMLRQCDAMTDRLALRLGRHCPSAGHRTIATGGMRRSARGAGEPAPRGGSGTRPGQQSRRQGGYRNPRGSRGQGDAGSHGSRARAGIRAGRRFVGKTAATTSRAATR